MDAEHVKYSSADRASPGLARRSQFIVLAVVAAALIAAYLYLPALYRAVVAKPAPAETKAAPEPAYRPTPAQWSSLKTQIVQERTFQPARQADGKIAVNDDRTTPVYAPYSGRVTAIYAREGDRLEQGQPLFRLDSTDLVQAQNDFVTALSGAAKAKTQVTLTQTIEQRNHQLFDAHGGSLKDWQQSQADLAAAQNDEKTAQIALAAVRSRLRILGQSDDDLAQVAATGRANAALVVAAPIDGTVLERKLGIGQYISQGGGDPLFKLGDLSTAWLVANVRESDTAYVRLGQAVEVRVTAYPGRVFNARITYVAASVDAATHRLPIRAEVDNKDGLLKPEMWAEFRIAIGDSRTALSVPTQAVVNEGEVARVWLVQPDESIVAREIKTGIVEGNRVEILGGLAAGDRVITQGSIFIDRAAADR